MVTLCADVFSSAEMPACSYQSMVAAAGARPEPFSAITFPVPAGAYKQKQSPPMPVDCGSITQSTAQAATAAWYADQGIEKIERYTPHSVTVPGAVDAWAQLLRDHGTRSLGDLLQPAIRFAHDGYAITERVYRDWNSEIETLSQERLK